MLFTSKSRRIACVAIVSTTVGAGVLGVAVHVGKTVHADENAPQSKRTVELGEVRQGALYAVTVAVKDPAQLQGNDAFKVIVSDRQGEIESKWLHAGDLDLYITFRGRSQGEA